MNSEPQTHLIFFITLGEEIPSNFFIFHRCFKELGFILVPIKIDQLQLMMTANNQQQVIVLSSVSDAREYKLFNDKVRGLLKYVLKSKRITFMLLSSFSKLNDQKNFSVQRNYFFLKFPLDAKNLCSRIARYHNLKKDQQTLWPGGKRSNAVGVV